MVDINETMLKRIKGEMMNTKVRRRTDVQCKECGRYRHRTCSNCGQKNLIGYRGEKGLFDHITGDLHGCDANSYEEDVSGSGDDDSPGGEGSDRVGYNQGGKAVGNAQSRSDSGQGKDSEGTGEGEGDGNQPLKGRKFSGTGALESMTRSELEAAVKEMGGEFQNRFDENDTDITDIVVGARAGRKKEAAENMGANIMSEAEFKELRDAFERSKNGQGQQGQGSEQQSGRRVSDEQGEMLDGIEQMMQEDGIDPDDLREALKDVLAGKRKIEIQIKQPNGVVNTVTGAHENTTTLIMMMGARRNPMLVGPAGSGKTKGVEVAAEALGLDFYPKSVGPATTEHSLFGYMDANGKYIPGIMREPFENGGVLLLDEIDAGNPACITALNTALANEYCSFPDQVVKRHPDFVAVASANTFGHGADRMYVGRNQMDAATRNRFDILPWNYDRNLERQIVEGMIEAAGLEEDEASKYLNWMERVWKIRDAIETRQIRMVAGTRDVIGGVQLMMAGFDHTQAEWLRFWHGASEEDRKVLMSIVGNP